MILKTGYGQWLWIDPAKVTTEVMAAILSARLVKAPDYRSLNKRPIFTEDKFTIDPTQPIEFVEAEQFDLTKVALPPEAPIEPDMSVRKTDDDIPF